jgi:O-Antigen ligase
VRGRGPVGLALGGCLALWALFAHPETAGGVPIAATVGIAVAAWLLGAMSGRVHTLPVVVGVAVIAAAAVLSGAPASLTGDPGAAPLGYANANAALLSAGVAGLVGLAARSTGNLRRALIGGALVLLLLCTATESRAATVVCVLLLLLLPVIDDVAARTWQLLAGVVVAGLFAMTVLLGATHDAGPRAAIVENTVGGTRTALWADALETANEHPARGSGPGTFETESSTAREASVDTAHSAPLQVAAELGWPGTVLLLALAGWAILALGRDAAVFAVLALQPMIDYTLEFPAVVALTACTLGALSATQPGRPGVRRGAQSG